MDEVMTKVIVGELDPRDVVAGPAAIGNLGTKIDSYRHTLPVDDPQVLRLAYVRDLCWEESDRRASRPHVAIVEY